MDNLLQLFAPIGFNDSLSLFSPFLQCIGIGLCSFELLEKFIVGVFGDEKLNSKEKNAAKLFASANTILSTNRFVIRESMWGHHNILTAKYYNLRNIIHEIHDMTFVT